MRWQTEEALRYIDARNDIGVTVDELYESGIFARRSDTASWLSRWKKKGYIRVEKQSVGRDDYGDWRSGRKVKYFTIVDGSLHDWCTIYGQSSLKKFELRQRMKEEDNKP